jgi:hypothetical protein
METKAEFAFEDAPKPFLDSDRLQELLEAKRAGMNFLSFALRDNALNGGEIDGTILALTNRLEGMEDDLQEFFGDGPIVLNPKHPQFEAICRAVHAAAKSGESEPTSGRKPQAAKASPFLLIPRSPAQESERLGVPVA